MSRLKILDPIVKRTSFLTLIVLGLVSIIFTIIKPAHMLRSLESIGRNILLEGNLGLTWYVIFFLAVELYFARVHAATESQWLFMVLVTYILLVYNLAYFSDPYHIGEFDSANRLVLQALPLVLLYLSIGVAQGCKTVGQPNLAQSV